MGNPMTADEQIQILKAAGLKVHEMPGWRTHSRAGHGAYGPINGLIIHHTGSDTGYSSMESYLYRGDDGRALPGPLCQWSIRTDGTVTMVGNGRANHAGMGDGDVLAAVRSENYGSYPPSPNGDNTDGNAHLMGIETQYSGAHAPTSAQYHAMVYAAAALCKHYGWTAKSVIGHKEWTSRKNDPGHVDMAEFRKDVQAAIVKLKGGGGTVSKPKTSAQLIAQLKKRVKNQKKKIKNLMRRIGG
jgi:hypothetical protein